MENMHYKLLMCLLFIRCQSESVIKEDKVSYNRKYSSVLLHDIDSINLYTYLIPPMGTINTECNNFIEDDRRFVRLFIIKDKHVVDSMCYLASNFCDTSGANNRINADKKIKFFKADTMVFSCCLEECGEMQSCLTDSYYMNKKLSDYIVGYIVKHR